MKTKSKKTTAAKNVKVVGETFALPPAPAAPVVVEAPPVVLGDSVPMTEADAASVRAFENSIAQTKLQLADLSLQALEVDRQRNLLAARVKEQHDS